MTNYDRCVIFTANPSHFKMDVPYPTALSVAETRKRNRAIRDETSRKKIRESIMEGLLAMEEQGKRFAFIATSESHERGLLETEAEDLKTKGYEVEGPTSNSANYNSLVIRNPHIDEEEQYK